MSGKYWYVLLLIMVCGNCSGIVSGRQCKKHTKPCGDGYCCCHGSTADCRNRRMTHIPEFPASTTTLLFSGNRLMNITDETFQNLTMLKLRILPLRKNDIENVSPNAFAGLNYVKFLDLSENVKTNKSALSIAFRSLQTNQNLTLNLDEMHIVDMAENFLDGLSNISVRVLSLRKNLLKSFNERAFEKLKNLQGLYLTKNRITDINGYSTIGLQNLEILFLDKNEFAIYPPRLCRNNQTETTYPKLNTLDLGENQIHILPYNQWECLPMLTKLSLNGNVVQSIRGNVFAKLKSLKTLNLSEMKGRLKSVETNTFNSTSLLELNIGVNGLNFATNKDIFQSCPNLQKLVLSHNYFGSHKHEVIIKLFSPLVKLVYLRAVDMNWKVIPDGLLQKLPNLEYINLDGNSIYNWTHSTFENVTKLQTFSMQGNNLNILRAEQFPDNLLESLQVLNLDNNPFACTCDNLWFRNWINKTLQEMKITIQNWPHRYKCASPPAWHRKYLADYLPTEASCRLVNPMIIVYATIGSFLFLFTTVSLVVYRQRWYIRYWFYKIKRNRSTNARGDNEESVLLPYDAYIIYNDEDRQFVREVLLKLVEQQHNYKLFIRHRDEPLGGCKLDAFADNIYASKNVIVVISQNFIADPWCQFQLEVALDRHVQLGKNSLLLALLEDVDLKSLNKTWCVILTKTPTTEWCPDVNDIRHTVFKQSLVRTLADTSGGGRGPI